MQRAHVSLASTHTREIGAQAVQYAIVIVVAVGRNGEEARGLVHHDEVVGLIRTGKGQPNRLLAAPIGMEGDGLDRFNAATGVLDARRTHVHLPRADRVLGPTTG